MPKKIYTYRLKKMLYVGVSMHLNLYQKKTNACWVLAGMSSQDTSTRQSMQSCYQTQLLIILCKEFCVLSGDSQLQVRLYQTFKVEQNRIFIYFYVSSPTECRFSTNHLPAMFQVHCTWQSWVTKLEIFRTPQVTRPRCSARSTRRRRATWPRTTSSRPCVPRSKARSRQSVTRAAAPGPTSRQDWSY